MQIPALHSARARAGSAMWRGSPDPRTNNRSQTRCGERVGDSLIVINPKL